MWKNERFVKMNRQQLNFFDIQKEEQVTLSAEEQEVLTDLNDADLLNMTPFQALQYIHELKEKLRPKKG